MGWFLSRMSPVEPESPKRTWVERLPRGEPMKDGLARLVDEDHDESETELYEYVADPQFLVVEREQRHYRGAFRRRMRRRTR